jgi:hypothetical protein
MIITIGIHQQLRRTTYNIHEMARSKLQKSSKNKHQYIILLRVSKYHRTAYSIRKVAPSTICRLNLALQRWPHNCTGEDTSCLCALRHLLFPLFCRWRASLWGGRGGSARDEAGRAGCSYDAAVTGSSAYTLTV